MSGNVPSLATIKSWVAVGQKRGATHMIVVCDTMQVYSFTGRHPIEQQLSEGRTFHYD